MEYYYETDICLWSNPWQLCFAPREDGGGGQNRETRPLKLETLEERQLLSVTPYATDPDDATAIVSTEIPTAASVPNVDWGGVEDANSSLVLMESESSGAKMETFRTDSGGGLDDYTNGSITFNINIDGLVDTSKSATLKLRVWDVDYNTMSDPNENERDMVSVNGHNLGYLTGANDSWSTCTFTISQGVLKTGDNTIRIDIDTLQTGNWAVECDWGEITCSVITPDISVDTVTLTCANPTIPDEWGAVVGEKAHITATLIENTDDHTFDDYEIVDLTWTVEKVVLDENGNKTGKLEKVFATNTAITDSRIAVDKVSGDQWTITYNDWLPEKGDHGDYKITCTVNYKLNGTGWFGTNFAAKTYSDSKTIDNAKVDVQEYEIFLGRCVVDENGSIDSTQSYNQKAKQVNTTKYSVKRKWYEDTFLKKTANEQWTELLKTLNVETTSIKGSRGELPDFYKQFVDYRFYLVFGKADKNMELAASSNGNIYKSDVVTSIYLPDIATIGNTATSDADFEKLVRVVSYYNQGTLRDWAVGDLIIFSTDCPKKTFVGTDEILITSYVVTEAKNTLWTDFEGVGLENCLSGKDSIYMMRGTEEIPQLTDIIWADLDEEGIGLDQYNTAKNSIRNWTARQSESVILLGHSLGGSLVQWGAADLAPTGKISRVLTFQSSGISVEAVNRFNEYSNGIDVKHYVSNGDMVSLAGEAFIGSGNCVTIVTYGDYNGYQCNTTQFEKNDIYKHNMWLLGDEKHNEKNGITNLKTETINISDFNSFWFHYSVPGILFGWNWTYDLDSAFIRGTTESIRKDLTSFILGEDIDSEKNWEWCDFNNNRSSYIQNGVIYYSADINIETPNELNFPGIIHYSKFGMNSVKVEYNENTPYDMNISGPVNNFSLYLVSADLNFSHIEDIKNMRADTDTLPNLDYSLEGNSTVYFGDSSRVKSKAELSISKYESFISENDDILHCNVDSLSILFNGQEACKSTSLNDFKLEDGSPTVLLGKGNALTGRGTFTFDVYDKHGNKKEITTENAEVQLVNGTVSTSVEISGTSTDGETLKLERLRSSVKLTVGEVVFLYNAKNTRFTSKTVFEATPSPAKMLAKGVVRNEASSSSVVSSVTASFNDSSIEINVIPIEENVDEDTCFLFYIDNNQEGFDGEFLIDVAFDDMVKNDDGSYSYSFDLSGVTVPSGSYSIYCHDIWEDETDSVYSNAFTLVQAAASLSFSEVSHDFADANIGTATTDHIKEFVITNNSTVAANFVISADEAGDLDDFYYSGKYSDDSDLTSSTVSLAAGESLKLTLYFVPSTVGEKTVTLKFTSNDESSLGSITVTGTALEVLSTDLTTTSTDSTISASSVTPGEALEISCKVNNAGTALSDGVKVTFYASSDASDITSGTVLGVSEVDWIVANESETFTLSIPSFPELAAGNYYIGWVVECDNDSDTTNNMAVMSDMLEVLAVVDNTITSLSDTPEDTNANGLFDKLNISSTIDVDEAGDYTVYYTLKDSMGTQVASVYETFALVAGENSLTLAIQGNDIFLSGLDGPYSLDVNISGTNYSYGKSDVFQTAAYTFNQFEGAQATFTGSYSDMGTDTDDDGKYNAMTINVGMEVTVAGNYKIAGTIVDANGKFVAFGTTDNLALQVGNHTIPLEFDALDIISNSQGGPFTLTNLRIEDVSSESVLSRVSNVYTTSDGKYALSDFDSEGSLFTGINTSFASDSDSNGLYNSLTFRLGVSVQTAGNYYLTALVVDKDSQSIKQVNQLCSLDVSSDKIDITIDGLAINQGEFDGPYGLFGIQLLNEAGETIARGTSFLTDTYSHSDFERMILTLSGEITDSINDTKTSLDVSFTATSENGGYYNANARIIDSNGNTVCWASTNVNLEANTPTPVTLNFDYEAFVANGVNGVFYVKDFSMYNTTTGATIDSVFITDFHETDPYNVFLQITPRQDGNNIIIDSGLAPEAGQTVSFQYRQATSRSWRTVKVAVNENGTLAASVKVCSLAKGRAYDVRFVSGSTKDPEVLLESQLTLEKLDAPKVVTSEVPGDFDAMTVKVEKFDEDALGVAVQVRFQGERSWSDWTQIGTRADDGTMQFAGLNGVSIQATATEGVYLVSGLPKSSKVEFRLMATGGLSDDGETIYLDSSSTLKSQKLAQAKKLATPNVSLAAIKGETDAMKVTVKSLDANGTMEVSYRVKQGKQWGNWSDWSTPESILGVTIEDQGNGAYKVTGLPVGATLQVQFRAAATEDAYLTSAANSRNVTLAKPTALTTPNFSYSQSKGFYNFKTDTNAAGYEIQYKLPGGKTFATLGTLTDGELRATTLASLIQATVPAQTATTYVVGRRYTITLKVTAKAGTDDIHYKDSKTASKMIAFKWTQELADLFDNQG
ncbi:MAG: CARDB domain-containing protein [Planctomycetia bacterium]|nr:CARDB domain-containing protein [Planctomycetia bacterium]